MKDILFKTDDYVFSYRVAGILIHDNRVLLQRPVGDTGYAFPGGHVAFGETNAEALTREFYEELSANIQIDKLQWVAEIFFPWLNKPCHQICLFYLVSLTDLTQIPLSGSFFGVDEFLNKRVDLEFSWISLNDINDIVLYPVEAKEKLSNPLGEVEHFIYRE